MGSATNRFKVLNISVPTVASCHVECAQNYTVNLCDCILGMDKRFIQRNVTENVRKIRQSRNKLDVFCLPEDMTDCVWPDVISGQNSSLMTCRQQCNPPCEQWVYHPSISHMKFPSVTVGDSMLERNLVLVDISFPLLQYIEITQVRWNAF